MATKSTIQTLINTNLADNTDILASEHRAVEDALLTELYPNSVTDSQATETYTTKVGSGINYSIRIVKSGNVAYISGTIRNTTSGILPSQNVFLWKSNDFKPKSGVNDLIFKAFNGSNPIDLFLSNNVLFLQSSILPTSTSYSFDFKTYITQD